MSDTYKQPKVFEYSVGSFIHLFSDDCVLYRVIKSTEDHDYLQQDLKHFSRMD